MTSPALHTAKAGRLTGARQPADIAPILRNEQALLRAAPVNIRETRLALREDERAPHVTG